MSVVLLQGASAAPVVPDLSLRPKFAAAMWTVPLNLPYGPRPGQASNVCAMDYYASYTPEDRARMRQAYFADRGYTDCFCGPAFEPHSYAGHFPSDNFVSRDLDYLLDTSQFQAVTGEVDQLLDILAEIPAAGGRIMYFLVPDKAPFQVGGHPDMAAIERYLTPHYSNPRWASLVRDWVLAWEPEWSSAEFVAVSQWARRVLGHDARIWIHLQPGHGAPGTSDENEAECWHKVTPYVDGFAAQDASMFGMVDTDPATGLPRTPLAQWRYNLMDLARRSNGAGYGGWPAVAYGGRVFLIWPAEYASLGFYHGTVTEAQAIAWGAEILAYPNLHGFGDAGLVTTA